jgi:leader peptidase (prepilin peptidase) / N-methyltransferase
MSFALLGWVLFGLALGSFANVCILRLPQGRSVAWPGSACPRCGAAIRWFQNIPVLSYILLRGRCASCRGPISPRYAMVELLTAALLAALFLKDAGSPAALALGAAPSSTSTAASSRTGFPPCWR